MIYTLRTYNFQTGLLYAFIALGLPYFALLGLNLATGVMLINKSGKVKRRVSRSKKMTPSPRRSNEVKATITILVMVLVFTLTGMPAMIVVSVYSGTVDSDGEESKLYGVRSNVNSLPPATAITTPLLRYFSENLHCTHLVARQQ